MNQSLSHIYTNTRTYKSDLETSFHIFSKVLLISQPFSLISFLGSATIFAVREISLKLQSKMYLSDTEINLGQCSK